MKGPREEKSSSENRVSIRPSVPEKIVVQIWASEISSHLPLRNAGLLIRSRPTMQASHVSTGRPTLQPKVFWPIRYEYHLTQCKSRHISVSSGQN